MTQSTTPRVFTTTPTALDFVADGDILVTGGKFYKWFNGTWNQMAVVGTDGKLHYDIVGTMTGVASEIVVVDTIASTCYIAMFDAATGSLAIKTDAGLTYNASTGKLSATGFIGPLQGDVTGNVTGNCSGSSGSCAGNAATASTANACSGNAATATLATKATGVDTATPVNAVAAAKVLTIAGLPLDNETVSIGGKVYTFQNAIGSGVKASGLLTVSGTPSDLDTVTIDTQDYRFRTYMAGVAAYDTLTVSGLPAEGDTITIGTKTYKFRAAIGTGAKATKDLTLSDVAIAAETVTIGGQVYTYVAALTEAKAASTLTLSANVTDGNSVTIGSTKYTFRETLAVAYDVLIGATASDTIDNLIAAINKAAGEGSTYGTGTVIHPSVTAAIGAGDTMDITAKSVGVAGNSIATTELSGVCSWTGAVMSGGVDSVANEVLVEATAAANATNLYNAINGGTGSGTKYSSATVAHTTVDATNPSGGVVTATAKSIGFAGNAIALAETLTNGAWDGGATFLSGGVDAEAANDVLRGANAEAAIDNLVLAITGGAGEGTNYGTGTTASTQVTAVKASASTMTVTALSVGVAGNSIGTTESGSNTAFDHTTLLHGEDVGAAYDVLIDGSAENSIDNLVLAITKGAGEGTKYGTGTVAHTTVTAVKATAATMTATALSNGDAGNSIATTKSGTNLGWGAGTLAGGEGAQAANDVLIGVNAEACIDNLVAAINGAAGEGTTYGNGTVAHTTVTAAKASSSTMSATAKTKGVAGNLIALAESLTNGSWASGATFLSGGVDGTVGVAGQVVYDATYAYVCIATNTIADANWRRIALGSAY